MDLQEVFRKGPARINSLAAEAGIFPRLGISRCPPVTFWTNSKRRGSCGCAEWVPNNPQQGRVLLFQYLQGTLQFVKGSQYRRTVGQLVTGVGSEDRLIVLKQQRAFPSCWSQNGWWTAIEIPPDIPACIESPGGTAYKWGRELQAFIKWREQDPYRSCISMAVSVAMKTYSKWSSGEFFILINW